MAETPSAERRFTVIDDHGTGASPQPPCDPRRAPRILVDGLDVSGKTTLTNAIITALAGHGIAGQRHRGMLAEHHPLEGWLHRKFPLVRQPGSSAVTTAWLAGFALDGLLSRVDPWVFAPFSLAVYLHAPAEARAARLAVRPDPDANDVRTVHDTAFAETFTAMLVRGMGRCHRRLLVFDTSRYAPEEMAAIVVSDFLASRQADVSPVRVQSAGRIGRAP
jgi:hypothetical protein